MAAWTAAGLGALVVAVVLVVKHEPALGAAAADGVEADRAAARLLTKAAALHAAVQREGDWGAAFTDAEANGWLATDLPRNHARLLPDGFSAPRVRFRPHGVETAIRVGSGLLSTVIYGDLGVSLRGVNQLGITVDAAAAGALPLPTAPVLAELGRRLAAAGAVTEMRRLDGRMMLVVYIPAIRGGGGLDWRLESLRIDAGELVVAGTTHAPTDGAGD